jgi:hypothetical protein
MALTREQEIELLQLEEEEAQAAEAKGLDLAGRAKAAGLGAAEGATFGFAEDVGAAAKTAYDVNREMLPIPGRAGQAVAAGRTAMQLVNPADMVSSYVLAKMRGQGKDIPQKFTETRQAIKGEMAESKEEYPKTYMAGEFAGAMAPTAVMPWAAMPARAKMGASAAMGAAQAVGYGEPTTVGEAAKDVALGGGLGLVTGAAGVGLEKAVQPGTMKTVRDEMARRMAGFTKRFLKTPQTREKVADAVETGIKEKILVPGKNAQEMFDAALQKEQEAGDVIGAFLRQESAGTKASIGRKGAQTLKAQFLFDPEEAVAHLEKIRKNLPPRRAGHVEAYHDALDKAIETVTSWGDYPIAWDKANEIKTLLQNSAGFGKQTSNAIDRFNKQIAHEYLDFLDTKLEQVASARGHMPNFEGFIRAKKVYGDMQTLKKGLDEAISQQQGNRLIGMMPGLFGIMGAGAGGAAAGGTGGMMGAGAGMIAGKLADVYGPGYTAAGAQWLMDLLKKSPQSLGKYAGQLSQAAQRGGQALAVQHYVLQQQDPDYQKRIQELQNGEQPGE